MEKPFSVKLILAGLLLAAAILACRRGTAEELHPLEVTDTLPAPSPTATREVKLETRTPVLTPTTRYQWGYVTVETLARRSGPGTSYPEYREPLHKGERVYASDACTDGENIWVMIGPEVWASSRFDGRVLISGEFVSGEPCK